MASTLRGMKVQKSRFAVLSPYIISLDDQDSGSDEDSTSWHHVAAKQPPKRTETQASSEESKGLSKNAKKRARKRRNKSTSSDQDVSV